jgi:hypothetical protein
MSKASPSTCRNFSGISIENNGWKFLQDAHTHMPDSNCPIWCVVLKRVFFIGVKNQFLWQCIVFICSNYIFTNKMHIHNRMHVLLSILSYMFRRLLRRVQGELYLIVCSKLLLRYLIIELKLYYTGRFIIFSAITNIYDKNTKGPTLMGLFTATGKPKSFFDN